MVVMTGNSYFRLIDRSRDITFVGWWWASIDLENAIIGKHRVSLIELFGVPNSK
jgi:hypothetical protein